jgi:hypothetical protein
VDWKSASISIFHRIGRLVVIREFTTMSVYLYLFSIFHTEPEQKNNVLSSLMKAKTIIIGISNAQKKLISNSILFHPSLRIETKITELYSISLFYITSVGLCLTYALTFLNAENNSELEAISPEILYCECLVRIDGFSLFLKHTSSFTYRSC